VATLPSESTLTLNYNVKHLIYLWDDHEPLQRNRAIMNVLVSTKGLDGGLDNFNKPPLQFSTRSLPSALYIYSCWWLFALRGVPLSARIYPTLGYGSLSLLSWYTESFIVTKAYNEVIDRLHDPAMDWGIQEKYLMLKFLRATFMLQLLAQTYFFRFSFLPTILDIRFIFSPGWKLLGINVTPFQ